jgi:peptidoglycan/xylan/chitin deacetylase (PgdA/CDA1 family)
MVITLAYHDVVDSGRDDASGFPGASAARYKLTPEAFRAHLAALAGVSQHPPARLPKVLSSPGLGSSLLLTFDDGGASTCTPIADLLEERGWRGHFCLPTDYIGTPGFLSADDVRRLHRRGHIIASHSCSHTMGMWSWALDPLVAEWRQSRAVLEDLLGEEVAVAAVPGGFYSRRVGEAAALAGIRVLFTSEPTTRAHMVGSCLVLGRFAIHRGVSPSQAAALAAGRWAAHARQAVWWKLKKAAKMACGPLYASLRELLLRRAYARQAGVHGGPHFARAGAECRRPDSVDGG